MNLSECPLCASPTGALVQDHPDFAAVAIHHCPACTFWFGVPVPDEAAIREYYLTTYAQQRTWSASPEYLALMERRASAQRDFIGTELGSVRSSIDIGCGVGALVAELTRGGIDAVGYDSDESVIRIGRQRWRANIHAEHVTGPEAAQVFDLLCLSHVVEHFRAPVSDLRALASRVRPGGWLFIEVPHTLAGMFGPQLEAESHLGFHTPRSLEILARSAGLAVVRICNCGPVALEHQQARREQVARERTRPWWGRKLSGVGRRVDRVLHRFFPKRWPMRTEYDGSFARYHPSGEESGLWLRALLRRPPA